MNTAAVAIGVNKTGHLTPLGGAACGAEKFAHWAEAQGMDVATVTDAGGPVRLNDILDVIEPIVRAQTYEKLVVFFAGHGFLLGPQTELWLLSGAPDRGSEAINVQLSRDYARYCGIPHVIFVSDACRSGGPSHRHRSVTGGAIFPVPASYDQVREVTTGTTIGADLWPEGEVSHIRVHNAQFGPGSSILIELSDGTGTVLGIKPEFIGTVLLEEARVVNVNYTPSRTSRLSTSRRRSARSRSTSSLATSTSTSRIAQCAGASTR